MGQFINALASPRAIVERKSRGERAIAAWVALLFLLGCTPAARATDLKPPTVQAWEAYVQTVNEDTASRASGSSAILMVDQSPEMAAQVRGGELVVTNHDPRKVPEGLIHDWTGAMFIPNVTLDQVVNVLGDYGHYSDIYKSLVGKSAVLDHNGDAEKITVVTVQRAFSVTAAVETENDVQFVRLDANRIYIVSNAERVVEIADYGLPSEHPFPENQRPGYVWRTVGVTRLEQRDRGVYVEMETVALSRGIPVEFRWLIKPLTDRLPRNIMLQTLQDTREAVMATAKPVW
jgi:hypothetical protein